MSSNTPLLATDHERELAAKIFQPLATPDDTRPPEGNNLAAWPGTWRAPGEPRRRTAAPWILVVDDAPLTRLVIRDILELHGYEVQAAANGAIALQLLDPEPPGLVVLDMRMPAMDGWEFARELQARGHAIPTLVIAAAPEAEGWAREIGAAGWLGKPFRLGDLLAAVARLRPSPDDPAGPPASSSPEQDR